MKSFVSCTANINCQKPLNITKLQLIIDFSYFKAQK